MNRPIQIHQALHGYKDGHQLLASSVLLPRDLQALTLTMSDLSGPGFRAGFETYLTGYPLDGVGHYCLARTWFAPEQSRPGCVWTHTLIIRFDDFARLRNLQQLETLFCRPRQIDFLEEYESPIELPAQDLDSGEHFPVIVDDVVAARVLDALYGTGQKVILSCADSNTFEELVLAVVDQQWPRLKRGFWFCTGSLSLREMQFDLSVSPPELFHPTDDSVLFIESSATKATPKAPWVKMAVADLSGSQRTELRAFLFRFGSDFQNGRAAFRPLTELHFLLSSWHGEASTIGDKVLSSVAYFFPEKFDGYRIKQEIFGLYGEFLLAIGGDAEVVRLALSHPGAATIDERILDVEQRAEDLARRQPAIALDFAVEALALDGMSSESYLSGYFKGTYDASSIAGSAPPSMLLYALARKPELLADPQVWIRLEESGMVSEAIAQLTDDAGRLHAAIAAMLKAKAWSGLNLVVRRFGISSLQGICSILQNDSAARDIIDYPDELFSLLWSRPDIATGMIARGEVPQVPSNMIAAEADPRSYQLRSLGLGPWIIATEERKAFASAYRERAACVFYLTISLTRLGDFAPIMISRSFSKVYAAIEGSELESLLLRRLEPTLTWSATRPGLAARLVRTVARAYSDEKWPVDSFAQTFNDPTSFVNALRELKDIWKGSNYIRTIKASRRLKNCPLSKAQIEVLERI